MRDHYTRYILPFVLTLCLCVTTGCQVFPKKNDEAMKKEMLQIKIENLEALYNAINTQLLKLGTNRSTVRDAFGEPDDIYSSATGISTFEIWTYEDIRLKTEGNRHPVRLYFDNDRLVNWSY